jgi:hypothetical protein
MATPIINMTIFIDDTTIAEPSAFLSSGLAGGAGAGAARESAIDLTVGSEEAHSVTLVLASVRRSNCTCRFPACSFHEDSFFRGAIEGIK